jgi:Lrp/AsnC family leucine-responsive transcriptional regulator
MRIQKESVRTLDKLDRHILRILQQDGRISMKDLGERVGLSVTPCIERVKRMERDGVISGYYAGSIRFAGRQAAGVCRNHPEPEIGQAFEQFRREVLRIPEVQECHLVSGDFRLPDQGAHPRDGRVPQAAG